MSTQKTYNRGQRIYVLLTSASHPNVYIPAQAIVQDSLWNKTSVEYLLKITDFYDSLSYLKKNLLKMNFSKTFGEKARKLNIKADSFKRVEDLLSVFNGPNAARYYITADSVFVVSTLVELKELFEKLCYFTISKNLKEIRDYTLRPLYKGLFSIEASKEFDRRFKSFFGDKFQDRGEDIEHYLKTLHD